MATPSSVRFVPDHRKQTMSPGGDFLSEQSRRARQKPRIDCVSPSARWVMVLVRVLGQSRWIFVRLFAFRRQAFALASTIQRTGRNDTLDHAYYRTWIRYNISRKEAPQPLPTSTHPLLVRA